MSDGRTYWWAKDASWWGRERIVELGEEFGVTGPAVVDYLSCEAKLQDDGGRVLSGFRSIARATFTEPTVVRSVVKHAASIGALDDVEVLADGRRFRCRVSGWSSDQDRALHSERQRRYRDRQKGTVTHRHAPSPTVNSDETVTSTAQDSTGKEVNVNTEVEPAGLDAAGEHTTPGIDGAPGERTAPGEREPVALAERLDDAKLRLRREVVQDLFGHWQRACGHPQAKLTRDRRRKVEARLSEGYTPEQIREAIDGAARAAFVSDDGRRFDDLELVCRSGSKLEDFMGRATQSPAGAGRWAEVADRLEREATDGAA